MVVIPITSRQITNSYAGFNALSELHQALSSVAPGMVQIDFQLVRWIDGHLAAPLLTVVRHAQSRGCVITFRNIDADVKLVLAKNGFLSERAPDNYHTTMPTTEFGLHGGVSFSQYTREHIMRPEMPQMTSALKSKFYEALDELFENSSLHSRATLPICVGGQFYPRTGKLAFSIVDGGIGIKGALLQATGKRFSGVDAVEWAMQPGNTTRTGDVPGGLGLKLIRSFIQQNGGSLTILSQDGYWCQTGANVSKTALNNPFPGTSVICEVDTSDVKHYDLRAAPDPRNIW